VSRLGGDPFGGRDRRDEPARRKGLCHHEAMGSSESGGQGIPVALALAGKPGFRGFAFPQIGRKITGARTFPNGMEYPAGAERCYRVSQIRVCDGNRVRARGLVRVGPARPSTSRGMQGDKRDLRGAALPALASGEGSAIDSRVS
jgi:hypothetical protein